MNQLENIVYEFIKELWVEPTEKHSVIASQFLNYGIIYGQGKSMCLNKLICFVTQTHLYENEDHYFVWYLALCFLLTPAGFWFYIENYFVTVTAILSNILEQKRLLKDKRYLRILSFFKRYFCLRDVN